MDENVPIRVNNPADAGSTHHSSETDRLKHKKGPKSDRRRIASIIACTVIVVAFLVVGWMLSQTSAASHIDSSKYQAVFLANGQVYFGKLQKLTGGYFRLTDVFYLQTDDTDTKSVQNATDSSSSKVQLIKLGNEVHGPDDEMIIDKAQVLFFENLKKDGTVTGSIDKYYKK